MKTFLYRTLPSDFNKDVYIWDVDKTYLNTHFESRRGLLRILIEASIDKTSLPGVKNLLLELRKGRSNDIAISPIYFVTASPLQLKKIIEGKFLIDGVQHDGLIVKDYLRLRKKVGKMRFKNNFSYKLMALLDLRLHLPAQAKETLFGDDYEMDAEVYSLYSNIIEHQISTSQVESILKHQLLVKSEIKKLLMKVEEIKVLPSGHVEKIFIHTIKGQPPEGFQKFGSRLISTRNYLQTAAILYQMEKISKEGFKRVANSFNLKYPRDEWSFQKSLKDLRERKILSPDIFDDLVLWR